MSVFSDVWAGANVAIGVFALWAGIYASRRTQDLAAEKKAQLDDEAWQRDRQATSQDAVDRYRLPLLEAAWRLGNRTYLIRERRFATTSEDRDKAVRTTAFRMAMFFAWREVLFREITQLEFSTAEETRVTSELSNDATLCFASTQLDLPDAALWAEEQRAAGELMLRAEDGRPIGYATFDDRYAEHFERWVDRTTAALLTSEAVESDRLRLLHWTMWALVTVLDTSNSTAREEWMGHTESEIRDWSTAADATSRERSITAHVRATLPG